MKINLFFTFSLYISLIEQGKQVDIKIVEEPSNYGHLHASEQTEQRQTQLNDFLSDDSLDLHAKFGGYNHMAPSLGENQLTTRVSPSNFSGPPHLMTLFNKCFSKLINEYNYELCFFKNITQKEQSYRWNPFNGVLGVWQEWEVKDNKLVAMWYKEGDMCGQIARAVKVELICGPKNDIVNVTEYSTCQYKMVFATPLACADHALLVYPYLDQSLQHQWDELEGYMEAGLLTQKGYDKRLHTILEAGNIYLSRERKNILVKSSQSKESNKDSQRSGPQYFDSLEKCAMEYQKLKDEIDRLSVILRVHGINVRENHKKENNTQNANLEKTQQNVTLNNGIENNAEKGEISNNEIMNNKADKT